MRQDDKAHLGKRQYRRQPIHKLVPVKIKFLINTLRGIKAPNLRFLMCQILHKSCEMLIVVVQLSLKI